MDEQENSSKGYEYETLMNMLRISVSKHLLDAHFTLVWANDFYYELIGYPKEEYEALYRNRPDLYYANEQEDWNALCAVVMTALQNGESQYSTVTRMRRKSGEYRWVQLQARFVDEYIDGCQVSYSAMTDITDIMQMKAEQSVTYDNLPGFVAKYRVGHDLSFTLLEANRQFLDFFGEESWKNTDYPLFRSNVERNASVFAENRSRLLAGEPVHFTVCMNSWRGSEAWFQINAACVDWQGKEPVYLVIYIDVTSETELRQMQKKLEEQAAELRAALELAEEASRAKTDFLSRMSHDIRTPMNAIIGMTEIASTHLDDTERVKNCLKKIALSSQHLLGLINDVLDMSKIESGKMALRSDTVSLPETLENVVAIMQPQFQAKSQAFSIRLHNVTHEQYRSDALRLRQILLNILSNGSKFTPEGGAVTMDVEERSGAETGVARLIFTFIDTGIGMGPEFLKHLFDAFSRERDSRVDKTEGTGLGMAITKKIVELLGGEITVRSAPGEGTTFRVALPLEIEKLPPFTGRLPDLRVLVVDDDDILCECTSEMLRTLGVCAECVGSGMEAVDRVAAAQRKHEKYDAVVLDWKMPGQDGLRTAQRIRSLCGDQLPILIISAYDWSDIEEEAQSAGVNGFLQKPIFASTLYRSLKKYVLGVQPGGDTEALRSETDLHGSRILLVEDNALNREVAQELLWDAGARVDTAFDGAQGVATFQDSAEGTYALILMDVQMPVMNGYEATRTIRALDRVDARTVPILAMTADAFAEDIVAAKECGMNGHLAKPLDMLTLRREIQKHLRT